MIKMLPMIRQLEEKNVANEIDILLWSDRMDLVAFSNVKGEVALHRLTWTRAFSLGPNKEDDVVKAMAWRPDSKVLAVGYNNGKIALVGVEDKNPLHTIKIDEEISSITWMQEKRFGKESEKLVGEEEEVNNYTEFIDYSSVYLPDPPSLSNYGSTSIHEVNEKPDFFSKQTEFNLLLVGTMEGVVHFYIFGVFPCATIDISRLLGAKCCIIDVYLSENLNSTYVTIKDIDGNIKLVILDSTIFESHTKELFCLALKYQYTRALLSYLSNTLLTMKETWEGILLELDSKLSKYAAKVEPGTLSVDFLELLTFGVCSDEMQEFLLHDLTKKGLEKFGQTIEMSYGNMQRLLMKNATKVGQNMTYHLSELRGMARLEDRYGELGLEEMKVTEAIRATGSFLIKSGEMQQIISNSMINYKAFFRWLYTAIIHLMYETVPQEIQRMTQQDLAYITDFLQNFDEIGADNNTTAGESCHSGFIMERLGQYLADSNLKSPPNMINNEWNHFLDDNECLKKHPLIIKHYKELSLVQQFNHFKQNVEDVYKKPHDLISKKMCLLKSINCINVNNSTTKSTYMYTTNKTLLFVFVSSEQPCNGFYLLEINCHHTSNVKTKAAFIQINQDLETNTIIDLKFYSENYLTILLHDTDSPRTSNSILLQCPLIMLRENLDEINPDVDISTQNIPKVGLYDAGEIISKSISMNVSKLAVSGSRRVSIVLSENRKKVILFEMEGEEEEEEDADMTNSTVRESDTSMQENSDAE